MIYFFISSFCVPVVQYRPSLLTHLQPLAHKFNLHSILQQFCSDPLSLQISQTIPFPLNHPERNNGNQNANVRLMISSPSAKSPVYMITTPTDKTAASIEGSSIWCFSMRPWPEQIDELVIADQYSDALALLDTVDGTLLPDKVRAKLGRNICCIH